MDNCRKRGYIYVLFYTYSNTLSHVFSHSCMGIVLCGGSSMYNNEFPVHLICVVKQNCGVGFLSMCSSTTL